MPPRLPRPICGCPRARCTLPNAWLHHSSKRLPWNPSITSQAASPHNPSTSVRRSFHASASTYDTRPSQLENIDDYYAELLASPLPASAASERPIAAPPIAPRSEATTPPDPAEQTPAQRAAIVFGSRLLPPNVRKANLDEAQARGEGEWLAGMWVPPRPPEPDNCCMSGCVNCVWDVYREDLEEWAAKRAEGRAADRRLKAQKAGKELVKGVEGDEDGVGSGADVSALASGDGDDDAGGLFNDIPVGIREFMKTEKMLQQRHRGEKRPEA